MSWGRGQILLALAIVPADHFSKDLARRYLAAEPITVLPVLDLSLSFNRGISFGLFASKGTWGWISLILLAVLVMGVVAGSVTARPARLSERFTLRSWAEPPAICTIAFPTWPLRILSMYGPGGWHFPTFKLADIAISIGAGMLLSSALMSKAGTRAETE